MNLTCFSVTLTTVFFATAGLSMNHQNSNCNADPAMCAAFTQQADRHLPGGSSQYVLVVEEASKSGFRVRIDPRTDGAVKAGKAISISVMDRKIGPEVYDDLMASLVRAYRKMNKI